MTDGGEEPEEGRSEAPEPPGGTAEAPTEDGEEPGDADPGESTAAGEGDPASTDLDSADPETTTPAGRDPDSAGSGAPGPGSTAGDRTETPPAEEFDGSDGAEDEVAGTVESGTGGDVDASGGDAGGAGAGSADAGGAGAGSADAGGAGAGGADASGGEPGGAAAGGAGADRAEGGGAEPVGEGASGEGAAQDETGSEESAPDDQDVGPVADSAVPNPEDVPPDVRKYDRFKKIDGSTYDRANEFLRDRTYITAREWAIARLCADFRTETGVEMTKIGEHLPQLVPFMTDTYSPQAVNQARHAFEEKVRKAGATFLYGAMCDFFTAEELDDVMYEATEVAKFLLEVEGVDLAVEEELAAEDRISSVMREVRESSAALRHDEVRCPECGHSFEASEGAHGVESESGE